MRIPALERVLKAHRGRVMAPSALDRLFIFKDAKWDEAKHPRADNGQFGSGSGGSSSARSNPDSAEGNGDKGAYGVPKDADRGIALDRIERAADLYLHGITAKDAIHVRSAVRGVRRALYSKTNASAILQGMSGGEVSKLVQEIASKEIPVSGVEQYIIETHQGQNKPKTDGKPGSKPEPPKTSKPKQSPASSKPISPASKPDAAAQHETLKPPRPPRKAELNMMRDHRVNLSSHEYAIHEHSSGVRFAVPKGHEHLAKDLAVQFDKMPEGLRKNTRMITLAPHADPSDKDWSERYGRKFTSSACFNRDKGLMFVWSQDGTPHLPRDGTMAHELAHSIDKGNRESYSAAYGNAVRSDSRRSSVGHATGTSDKNKYVSAYARDAAVIGHKDEVRSTRCEDFAESVKGYLGYMNGLTADQFRRSFPSRAEYLDKLFGYMHGKTYDAGGGHRVTIPED